MNTVVTSREQILQVCRELIQQQGWSAVSIRSVAGACGISVGSIYNYFQDKSQLVGATVESVWLDIFRIPPGQTPFDNILDCVGWMFACMEEGSRRYPNFFSMHSMAFVWLDIFRIPPGQTPFDNILDCVGWMFACMEEGSRRYPNFFSMHSMAFLGEGKAEGQKRMAQSWAHMRQGIAAVLASDQRISPDAFAEGFTREDLAQILFSLLLSALMRHDYDPVPIQTMLRRLLYK